MVYNYRIWGLGFRVIVIVLKIPLITTHDPPSMLRIMEFKGSPKSPSSKNPTHRLKTKTWRFMGSYKWGYNRVAKAFTHIKGLFHPASHYPLTSP